MTQSSTGVKSSVVAAEHETNCVDARDCLAAAVVATLIEYRRHVQQRNGSDSPTNDAANWRMLACWERLRGRE